MAPAKNAKPAEYNPWGWVTHVGPADVNETHIKSAYRITGFPPCVEIRRNCRRNPYCLWGLGEKKWRDDIDGDEEEEGAAFRCEGEYAGLQNLGATCYVNSLLQLWFHNPIFRPAVLKWTPTLLEMPGKYKARCPLAQLQAIFARLKISKKSKIDPSDFVRSLLLNTGEQQDAQEFAKLFMDFIVKLLTDYGDDHIRKLIAQSFNGQLQYETECLGCNNKTRRPEGFTELNLSVKKNLGESLDALLEDEIISDEYMCSNCQKKSTAKRRMQLLTLPPILNLQLLRFVYDREAQRRKKVTQNISFPEVLEMHPRIYGTNESTEPALHRYHLTAVLIHNGQSASSGHYVAQIKDLRNGEWLKFNDEFVDSVSKKSQKLKDDDFVDDDEKKVKLKKNKNSPSLTSAGAYMLVYTLEQHINNPEPDPELHQYLIDMVRDEDVSFELEVNKNKNEKDFELAVRNQRKKEVQWLYGFGKSTVDAKTEDSGIESSEEPKQKMPRFDSEVTSKQADLANNLKHEMSDANHREENNYDSSSKSNGISDPNSKSNGLGTEVSTLPPKGKNSQFAIDFVSVDWISQWLDPGNPVPPVENAMLLCEHKKLAPPAPNTTPCLYRIVPSPLAQVWYEHYQGGPRLRIDDLCRVCVQTQCRKLRAVTQLEEDAKLVSDLVKRWDSECTLMSKNGQEIRDTILENMRWISKESLRNWKRMAKVLIEEPSPTKREGSADDTEQDQAAEDQSQEFATINGPFNADLFCEHGNLSSDVNSRKMIPVDAWKLIEKYFKDPITLEATGNSVCGECLNQEQANSMAVLHLKEKAGKQKAALTDLYLNRNRPDVDRIGEFFIVPSAFIAEWRRFIRDPGRYEVVEKVTNATLICPHDKFKYPMLFVSEFLKFDEDAYEMVCLITPEEWGIIQQHFNCDQEIKVTIESLAARDKILYEPDICTVCAEKWMEAAFKKQFEYQDAPIYIIKREKGEASVYSEDEEEPVKESPIVTGKREVKQANPHAWMAGFSSNSTSVRRSQRPRNSKGEKTYKVSSTMTIKELKSKIYTDFKALLSDQHLFHDGHELEDISKTLSDYQIPVRGKIYLEIDTAENGSVEEPASTVETGFRGTLLIGGNGFRDTRSPVQNS